MTLVDFLFGSMAVLAVGSAIYAVTTRYLLRAIVAFGAFLTAVAGEFFLLAADFVALIQIFVYVGGVVVLMLFALMLSSTGERHPQASGRPSVLAILVSYAVAGFLIVASWGVTLPRLGDLPEETTSLLGRAFLGDQVVAFELIGVILLAALVAALTIVRGEEAVAVAWVLIVSGLLLATGVYGVLTRRNAITLLISVEIMMNAANLNFVAFSRLWAPTKMTGQVFALLGISIAACEAAVGLALILAISRRFGTTDVDRVNLLKG